MTLDEVIKIEAQRAEAEAALNRCSVGLMEVVKVLTAGRHPSPATAEVIEEAYRALDALHTAVGREFWGDDA